MNRRSFFSKFFVQSYLLHYLNLRGISAVLKFYLMWQFFVTVFLSPSLFPIIVVSYVLEMFPHFFSQNV